MHSISIAERASRLNAVSASWNALADEPLLRATQLSSAAFQRLESAAALYVWDTLCAAGARASLSEPDRFFADNIELVLNLPNRTPNGLLLPKRENILSYNILQREVCNSLSELGLLGHIDRIHAPVNVRVSSGRSSPALDSRPRSSRKLHTDIWAGEPTNALMAFIGVFGDHERTGIEFFEPETFPLDWARPLVDYSEGEALGKGSRKYDAQISRGGFFLTDPFLLHRTMPAGGGPRLSIDFRFIPKLTTTSDISTDTQRTINYVPLSDWMRIGSDALCLSEEKIGEFDPAGGNKYSGRYRIQAFQE